MPYSTSITISNAVARELTLRLEPWADEIKLLPGASFKIIAEAENEGSLEFEYGEDEIIVWAWPSSIVRIISNGEEVGDFAGILRPTAPSVPEGQTMSDFIRSTFKSKEDS
jgi:hypothetical protein